MQWGKSKEQQAEGVVQASLSILRKNLAHPFSLTLLNIGATSFLATTPAQRVVPKALKSFLDSGQGANRHKSTSSQQVAGLAGAHHGIQADICL